MSRGVAGAVLRLVHSAPPDDGHPEWCARDHRCTAMTMPAGEHTSVPEVWVTDGGRVVGTRHLGRNGRDFVEIRHVLELSGDEEQREQLIRELMVGANWALRQVADWQPGADRG